MGFAALVRDTVMEGDLMGIRRVLHGQRERRFGALTYTARLVTGSA